MGGSEQMMQYFVVLPDGQKFGPADLATLNQWASEGRLTPQSQLEDVASGQTFQASAIAGLIFPGAPGPTATAATPSVGAPSSDWSNPPQGSPYPRVPYTPADNGQKELTLAWVFGSIGLLCCPIIFSTIGIVYAVQAKNKGNASGNAALIFCICTMVAGFIIGAAFNLARLRSL